MDNWEKKIEKNSEWSFVRNINDINNYKNETIIGNVKWEKIDNSIYLYHEKGKYLNKDFYQKYIFDFINKKVLFTDNNHFYNFPEKDRNESYKCNQDMYDISISNNELTILCNGPSKNYKINTVFKN